MHMTAYARLEQFRIDIEKLLSEKAIHDENDDQCEDTEKPETVAPDGYPSSTTHDAVGDGAARNFFQAVDDALAVLN